MTTDLTALAASRYVSLTTTKKSGATVATPVWVARDGDGLVVVTGADSGKVKRIRNNPAVTLSPCKASGKVAPDAPRVEARAEVLGPFEEQEERARPIRSKYGIQFRIFLLVERVASRGKGPGLTVLRLSAPRPYDSGAAEG